MANSVVYFDTAAQIVGPLSGYQSMAGGVTINCGSGCPGTVKALLSDGAKIYVGGDFDNAGTVASRGFARYDTSVAANNWSSPGTVGGGSFAGRGTVNAIIKAGPSYYIGGDFSTVGPPATPVAASNVASFNPATNKWAPLGSGVSGPVSSLAQSSDGLYLGGSFSVAGIVPSQNLALWTATASPRVSTFTPGSGTANVTSVAITGSHLTGTTTVKFNGTQASFQVLGDTKITALVPAGASTGKISVATAFGTGTSSTAFTV